MMLRALVADNAFVWGLVDVSTKDSCDARLAATQPFLSRQPLTTTVTHHSLRAANLHLQRLAPPRGDSKKELESYTAAVSAVFADAPPGLVPNSMVAHASEHLTAQYATAVRSVRAALLRKGVHCCACLIIPAKIV